MIRLVQLSNQPQLRHLVFANHSFGFQTQLHDPNSMFLTKNERAFRLRKPHGTRCSKAADWEGKCSPRPQMPREDSPILNQRALALTKGKPCSPSWPKRPETKHVQCILSVMKKDVHAQQYTHVRIHICRHETLMLTISKIWYGSMLEEIVHMKVEEPSVWAVRTGNALFWIQGHWPYTVSIHMRIDGVAVGRAINSKTKPMKEMWVTHLVLDLSKTECGFASRVQVFDVSPLKDHEALAILSYRLQVLDGRGAETEIATATSASNWV